MLFVFNEIGKLSRKTTLIERIEMLLHSRYRHLHSSNINTGFLESPEYVRMTIKYEYRRNLCACKTLRYIDCVCRGPIQIGTAWPNDVRQKRNDAETRSCSIAAALPVD